MGLNKTSAGLKRFADETTIHGFSHVANSRSRCERVLWISALLVALCLGSYTIAKTILEFLNAPPIKTTGVESLQLSNLTMRVCPKHILNVSRIMEERPNLMALSFAFLGLNQFYAREGPAIIIDDWHPMGVLRLHYHLWSTALRCVQPSVQINAIDPSFVGIIDLESGYSDPNDLLGATGLLGGTLNALLDLTGGLLGRKKRGLLSGISSDDSLLDSSLLESTGDLSGSLLESTGDLLENAVGILGGNETTQKPTSAPLINESICNVDGNMAAGIISSLRTQLRELMNRTGAETIEDLLLSYSISYPSLGEVCETSCKINNSHANGKRVLHDGRVCFEYIIPSDTVVGKSLHLKAFLPPDVNYLMEFWKASDAAYRSDEYHKFAPRKSGIEAPSTFYDEYYYASRRFLAEDVMFNMQASPTDELMRLDQLVWNQISDYIVENETIALQLLNAEGLEKWAKRQNSSSQVVNMARFSELQIAFNRFDVKEKGDPIVFDLEGKSEFQFEFQRLKVLHDADNQCLKKPSTTEPTDVCQYKCFNQRHEDCIAKSENKRNVRLCSLHRESSADSSCQSLDFSFLWPDASKYHCTVDTWNECLPRETGRGLGIQECFEACETHTITVRENSYRWRHGGTFGKKGDVRLDFRAAEFTNFMEESQSQNWEVLAGNIGGLLGLISGVSLISILHLCMTISCGCCNKLEK